MNIQKELAMLQRLSPKQLRERYAAVFGEVSRSGNRDFLVKRIAWRLQANAEGGLSERAKRRAEQLARDSDVRVTAPKTVTVGATANGTLPNDWDERLPAPGSVLARKYKGRTIQVAVLDGGEFEWQGARYRTLSAVARAITGTHTNGFLFFKLGSYAS